MIVDRRLARALQFTRSFPPGIGSRGQGSEHDSEAAGGRCTEGSSAPPMPPETV